LSLRRPRIALATNALGIGGTEKGLVTHALALDRERFDPLVVTLIAGGSRREALERAGIEVVNAGARRGRLLALLEGVDVVHVFRGGLAEPPLPGACREAGVRVLIETNIFGEVDASSDDTLFDCHLFVSKMCALRYRRRLGLGGPAFHERHRVSHWPIDLTTLRALAPDQRAAKRQLGLDPDRPVVARIGRADDRKWRTLLIDMVPHLLKLAPETQLMMVGATPATRRRLQRLGALDRVKLVEPVTEDATLATLYRASDVFVTAAEIGESYSVAICEAMALGLPVVTCSTPWVDNGQIEQVDEGETGHIADHPVAFAEAVAHLVRDPDLRAHFGRAAAEKADRLLDAGALTRQLERLYTSLLAGNGVPAEWMPSPAEVDAFETEYEQRLRSRFRPLSRREQFEVTRARAEERVRWAARAARFLDRRTVAFAYWNLRRRLASLTRIFSVRGCRPTGDGTVVALDALAARARSRVIRTVTTPQAIRLVEPLTKRRVHHLGLSFDTRDLRAFPHTRALMFWGIYERTECLYVKRHLVGSRCVLELGSGIGISSAHVAAVMARGGHLVCLEANPALHAAIRANLRPLVERRELHLTVLAAAIGNGGPHASFTVTSDFTSSHLSGPREGSGRGTMEVEVAPLISLVKQHAPDGFDLVCDIEGAEAAFILADELNPLDRCSRMVIELHDCTWQGQHVAPDDLLDALVSRWGFQLIERRGPVAALRRGPA
jgi:FkbM family methyltransferase